MGTGITDVIGGPHNFLPPRSDEFQKLCSPSIKDCLCLIKYVLRCLYIEDDNRFIFLTEIKNVGKPETDIDV